MYRSDGIKNGVMEYTFDIVVNKNILMSKSTNKQHSRVSNGDNVLQIRVGSLIYESHL